MIPGEWNTIVDQGATWLRHVDYTDDAGNSPDLSSGYTASMVFADHWAGATLFEITDSSGITLGASGSIDLEMTPAETEALQEGALVHHLEITHTASGRITRLLRGEALVRQKAGA